MIDSQRPSKGAPLEFFTVDKKGDWKELAVQVNWHDVPIDTWPKIESVIILILTVLAALVDHEDGIHLIVHANHRRMCITARVGESDVGFAIGSHGAHANALRTLLIAACKKVEMHFEIDIGGPSGATDWSSS